ncbi:MAG TPA: hypothetical protein DCQ50_03150 [Chryseobacterium sp.]|nr:hypothetical protein [Chryseobacterium sp.]
MKTETTCINGVFVLNPVVYPDNRGLFFESYQKEIFEKLNINTEFVQDIQ